MPFLGKSKSAAQFIHNLMLLLNRNSKHIPRRFGQSLLLIDKFIDLAEIR
jgi:hypothetical protein